MGGAHADAFCWGLLLGRCSTDACRPPPDPPAGHQLVSGIVGNGTSCSFPPLIEQLTSAVSLLRRYALRSTPKRPPHTHTHTTTTKLDPFAARFPIARCGAPPPPAPFSRSQLPFHPLRWRTPPPPLCVFNVCCPCNATALLKSPPRRRPAVASRAGGTAWAACRCLLHIMRAAHERSFRLICAN